LKRIPGYKDFSYDYIAPPPDRLRAKERAWEIWSKHGLLDRTGDQILIDPAGTLQTEKFTRLLQQRNDRSMYLQE